MASGLSGTGGLARMVRFARYWLSPPSFDALGSGVLMVVPNPAFRRLRLQRGDAGMGEALDLYARRLDRPVLARREEDLGAASQDGLSKAKPIATNRKAATMGFALRLGKNSRGRGGRRMARLSQRLSSCPGLSRAPTPWCTSG